MDLSSYRLHMRGKSLNGAACRDAFAAWIMLGFTKSAGAILLILPHACRAISLPVAVVLVGLWRRLLPIVSFIDPAAALQELDDFGKFAEKKLKLTLRDITEPLKMVLETSRDPSPGFFADSPPCNQPCAYPVAENGGIGLAIAVDAKKFWLIV